jgi:hypothetical protein
MNDFQEKKYQTTLYPPKFCSHPPHLPRMVPLEHLHRRIFKKRNTELLCTLLSSALTLPTSLAWFP